MNNKTKKMTTVAMLCAIAYVVMAVGRIPIVCVSNRVFYRNDDG